MNILALKDKSGVGIIVAYSRDCTVVNGVQYFFQFFSFNLRNYILQSAKKCEMTSFCMTSLHVDLNEAAKCVDIIPLTTHRAKSPKFGIPYRNQLSKFDLSLTKIAKRHTPARTKIASQTRSLKEYTLADGTSPGTFIMEDPPSSLRGNIYQINFNLDTNASKQGIVKIESTIKI